MAFLTAFLNRFRNQSYPAAVSIGSTVTDHMWGVLDGATAVKSTSEDLEIVTKVEDNEVVIRIKELPND